MTNSAKLTRSWEPWLLY